MPPRIDDRWVWLGFGIFFYFAARGIRYAIRDVVQLTKLEAITDENAVEKRDLPEDNISVENLKILAESPHPNISSAAISLIVSRFYRQPNLYRSIIKDIDGETDETTRNRARLALSFLRRWPLMSDFPDLGLPRYSPATSESGMYSPSLPALENMEVFRDEGTAERSSPSASRDTDAIVPSEENPVAGWTNVPRERPTDSESERRRVHREAMVLREGEGRVEEGDIIRPTLAD